MNNKNADLPLLSRRTLLAGAAAVAGASLLASSNKQSHAQTAATQSTASDAGTVVFTNTTVVTNDIERRTLLNVALAVQGDRIVAIGDTNEILAQFPSAEIYDGSRKALLPGLVNCHAHLQQALDKGFNEDFGFPNSLVLPFSPASLISREESTIMSMVGALEGLRSGTTTMVQNVGGIANDAAALVTTGQRWVFAESVRDIETVDGPMSPPRLANSVPPRFSDRLRVEGMQRISDLFDAWHGHDNGRVQVFPAAALVELSSPQLLRDVREFADRHNLGYTIHMTQSQAEVDFMLRYHGVRPAIFLEQHGYLGPKLFAAHARYVDDTEIAALVRTQTIVSNQAAMAANRGVSPPITALRDAGVRICMGTDNNNNDMLHVMKTAISLERIQRNDEIPGTLPQPEDMLNDACTGGAFAVNLPDDIGSLEVGKKADILVLDVMKPHLTPSGRILSAWIHNGQPSDIETVMVDGRFIMRNHRVLTVDEAAIMEEAYQIGQRVWGRMLENGPVPLPRFPG
ncbi:MAG: amidohydrolase family protein [Pseudohongiella sp.]|nr:amidohydrolase family protein [Pseudohongiella sp.]